MIIWTGSEEAGNPWADERQKGRSEAARMRSEIGIAVRT